MLESNIIPFEKYVEKRNKTMDRLHIKNKVYHLLKTASIDIVPYMYSDKHSIYLTFNHDDEKVRIALNGRVLFALTYWNKDKVLNIVKSYSELHSEREGYILVDSLVEAQMVVSTVTEQLNLFFCRDITYDCFINSIVSGWDCCNK